MTNRQLGRRTPKNAPALRLADFLTGQVPEHPISADHFARVTDWGLWKNDTYGDCGPVSYGNLRKLVSSYLVGVEQPVTEADVLALYTLVNPTFNPADPGGPGDAGVDMQTMLELALQHGFAGAKPVGFAKVDTTNLDEVRAAISIFGGLLLGVDLETAQQTQTDAGGPWDFSDSPVWGGHAVLAGLYTGDQGAGHGDVSVVTWAQVMPTTDAFEQHQLAEAWVVIFPEHLDHPAFQEGVDLAALATAYQELTGRPFPAVVPPAPTPVPPAPVPVPPVPAPADPLTELAAMFRQWIGSIEAWFTKHGL